jgi:hypothetical protein
MPKKLFKNPLIGLEVVFIGQNLNLQRQDKIITLKERNLCLHKSLPQYPNYLTSAKKWNKAFKRSKISSYFAYFQNF